MAAQSTEYSFNPCTTIAERRVLCERMGGLSAQKVKYCWKVNGHKITENVVTRKVQGDGNCLFRVLAYLISGDEENHLMVRAVITEAIAKAGPGSVIQQFIGREPVGKYILRIKMPRSSVWGTEVEIFTAAQILQMDIYTYTFGQGTSPDQDKLSWGRFPYVYPAMVEEQKAAQKAAAEESKKPVDQHKPYKFTKDQPTPRALYLDNSTRYHYAPVVGFR